MPSDKKKRNEKAEDNVRTKEETAVAKYLRWSVPNFEGKLEGIEVLCFKGEDAVNKLLDSKWTKGENALFTTRASCVAYCQRLLEKETFHLAERERRKGKKKKEEELEKTKKKKQKKKDETEVGESGDAEKESKEDVDEKKSKKEDEKKEKKKKRKTRLIMPQHQYFADGEEVFVWIFDPTPLKNYLIGGLLVFGSIGVCLFPLWPPSVRVGIYYLSVAAAVLVGSLFATAILRNILFAIIWLATFGKHHFWLLPNLTEDVGVLESFQPWYTHTVVDKSKKKKSQASEEKVESKGGKDDSPAEEDGDAKRVATTAEDSHSPDDTAAADDSAGAECSANESSARNSAEDSDGFEVLDKDMLNSDQSA